MMSPATDMSFIITGFMTVGDDGIIMVLDVIGSADHAVCMGIEPYEGFEYIGAEYVGVAKAVAGYVGYP